MLQKVKDIYSESIQIQISASSLLSENIKTFLPSLGNRSGSLSLPGTAGCTWNCDLIKLKKDWLPLVLKDVNCDEDNWCLQCGQVGKVITWGRPLAE